MSFVGVDGCKKGWFAVTLTGEDKWQTGVFKDIRGVWEEFKGVKAILVDIPIGLKEKGSEERECDVEARRLLHSKRASSVFRPPCRRAVYSSMDKASEVNFVVTGKRLSCQTLNILQKIREVDAFLLENKYARSFLRETHPVICFWVLAGRRPMKHRKKENRGFLERKEVLESVFPRSKEIIEHPLTTYRRKDVARDDILDALVLAITAKFGFNKVKTIPEGATRDSRGLLMEMVYYVPSIH